MPNISVFTSKKDIPNLLQWFNEHPDLAYMINIGEGKDKKIKWRTVDQVKNLDDGHYQLWHIPSGKIIVEGEKRNDPDWIEIESPNEGYEAYPYNNNWEIQNTGNHPQFFDLEIRTNQNEIGIGLTSLGWIGSRYTKPKDCTKEFWKDLRRFINRSSLSLEPQIYEKLSVSNFKCFEFAANSMMKCHYIEANSLKK